MTWALVCSTYLIENSIKHYLSNSTFSRRSSRLVARFSNSFAILTLVLSQKVLGKSTKLITSATWLNNST